MESLTSNVSAFQLWNDMTDAQRMEDWFRMRLALEPSVRYHCTICGGEVDLSGATKPEGLSMAGRTRTVAPAQVRCKRCGDTGRQWDNGDMIECDHVVPEPPTDALRTARLEWALLCACECPACKRLHERLQSLCGDAPTKTELARLRCGTCGESHADGEFYNHNFVAAQAQDEILWRNALGNLVAAVERLGSNPMCPYDADVQFAMGEARQMLGGLYAETKNEPEPDIAVQHMLESDETKASPQFEERDLYNSGLGWPGNDKR